MSKPSTSQAFLYLILTILVIYVLASLFSFSIFISEWNAFSNIIFWGASIVLTVWTLNDYVINAEPKNPNETYIEKQNQQENKNEEATEFQKEAFDNLKKPQVITGNTKSNENEPGKLTQKFIQDFDNLTNHPSDSKAKKDLSILSFKLLKAAQVNVDSLIGSTSQKVTNQSLAEMLLFNSSFIIVYLKLVNPKQLEHCLEDYRKFLDFEMKHLGFHIDKPTYQKFIDSQINRHTSVIRSFPMLPFDCSGSVFHNFFIKPFDNYPSDYNNISLITDFYSSLRAMINRLKKDVDKIVNKDYKHTQKLSGYDALFLNKLEKMSSTVSCHKEYLNSPNMVFELCQKAVKLFPINYVEEFGDRTYEDYDGTHSYFDGKYPECRYFTALSYCCSIAINYLKIIHGYNEYDNPANDCYFKEFIKLMIVEARKIDYEEMEMSLCTSFDDGFDFEEEIVLDYLFKVIDNINYRGHGSEYELEKLAYNYYESPGTLRFSNNYKSMLDDKAKCEELDSLIGKTEDFILEKIFYCKNL